MHTTNSISALPWIFPSIQISSYDSHFNTITTLSFTCKYHYYSQMRPQTLVEWSVSQESGYVTHVKEYYQYTKNKQNQALSHTHTNTNTHTHKHTHTHEHAHTNTCRHVNNFMSNNFHSTVPSSGWTRIMFVKLQWNLPLLCALLPSHNQ